MPAEIVVIRAGRPLPASWTASVYLCGPTPLDPAVPSWRAEAVHHLGRLWDGDGELAVFLPEPEAGEPLSYPDQIRWEEDAMRMSDVVLFYVPRALPSLPGLVTNVKWGAWHRTGRVVLGSPAEAERNEYLLHFAHELEVPVAGSVEETTRRALARLGSGARRSGGERRIPLQLWSTPEFRRWYGEQRAAGRVLCSAEVLWAEGGPAREWALRAVLAEAAAPERTSSTLVVRAAGCEALG
ncbi:nucleoside 2-deoxyribosyltransferase domain-containing protein [Streptomyces olivoreticuli]